MHLKSGFLQASLLMLLENYVGRTLTFEELKSSPQTCVVASSESVIEGFKDGSTSHSVKDYSLYLMITSLYMAAISAIFGIFFRTQQKRANVDKEDIGEHNPCKMDEHIICPGTEQVRKV